MVELRQVYNEYTIYTVLGKQENEVQKWKK